MTTTRTRKRPALERVVATASRLFYEMGIHATGVDLIAQEANVSKATLYTYFATKDDLVAEYLRRRSAEWQAHVNSELSGRGTSARERILAVYDLLDEWFGTPDFRGCPFINAEAECGAETPAHAINLVHRAWVHALFRDLLTEAGVRDVEQAARGLHLLYDAAMSSAQVEPGVRWADAAKHAAEAIVDAGLR